MCERSEWAFDGAYRPALCGLRADPWFSCCRAADRHILHRAPEIEAVRDSGAPLVNLASDEVVTRFAQLEVVICHWRRIESLLTETGPFIYFATRTSFRKARLPR